MRSTIVDCIWKDLNNACVVSRGNQATAVIHEKPLRHWPVVMQRVSIDSFKKNIVSNKVLKDILSTWNDKSKEGSGTESFFLNA